MSQVPNVTEATEIQRPSYSLRTLLFTTALIAWILAVNNWLGDPYGWLTAIPLALGLPIFILRPWTFVGAIVGFAAFALIGDLFIIGWDESAPQYLPCLITVGGYGLTCGSCIHAFFLRLRSLACVIFIAVLVVFVIVLQF